MNKWITFLLFILLTLTSCPQVHGGIQRFIHIAKGPCGFVSKRYFETGTIWHAEARYNYEDQNTNSRNEGNHFVYLKWKPLSISPVTGIVFASFIDGNISSKINEGCKKLSISLEAQFSFCFGKKSKNYFYSGPEFGFQYLKILHPSMRGLWPRCYEAKSSSEPDKLPSARRKGRTFPPCAFNPAEKTGNYVMGLSWNRITPHQKFHYNDTEKITVIFFNNYKN